jgi:ribosomal protein S18 acetylase RimI-like enzyme
MPPETLIRPCLPGDEHALALVGQATFLETFAGLLAGPDIIAHCASAHAVALYRGWLADPDCQLWLVETQQGRAPVGFMLVAPARLPLPDLSPRDREIKRIYMLGKFQGGGTGKKLVAEALAHARARNAARLLLGVYAGNAAAIGFYERMGFGKLGSRQFDVGGQSYDDNIMGMSV